MFIGYLALISVLADSQVTSIMSIDCFGTMSIGRKFVSIVSGAGRLIASSWILKPGCLNETKLVTIKLVSAC